MAEDDCFLEVLHTSRGLIEVVKYLGDDAVLPLLLSSRAIRDAVFSENLWEAVPAQSIISLIASSSSNTRKYVDEKLGGVGSVSADTRKR